MKKHFLVACVATVALVVATPAAGASHARPADAHIAKKCKKKHGKKKKCKKAVPVTPVVTPPPPVPAPLTDAEVISRVTQQAQNYCDIDADCVDYGYYYTGIPTQADCESKSTYSWSCYGWNYEYWPGDDPDTDYWYCDFREVVERVGQNGITSHQDTSFGSGGFDCYPDIP
jgi:hypothetical protein